MTSPDSGDFFGRTFDALRRAGEAARDGVLRTKERATLMLDVSSLRRSLDDVTREIGRQAIATLRESGTLSAEQVAAQLRRVDEIEDEIAAKERRIADIERDADPSPAAATSADPDATVPRRKPTFGQRPDDANGA